MLSRAIAALSLALCAFAQDAAPPFFRPAASPVEPPDFQSLMLEAVPASEVTRITPLQGGPGTATPTRITMYAPASALFEEAFAIPLNRIGNLDKGYVTPGVFALSATLPEDTTRDQYRAMLRRLLTERFGLRYHRERGEGPVYELTIDPAGIKFRPSGSNAAAQVPSQPTSRSKGTNPYAELPPGRDAGPISLGQGLWALRRIGVTMEEFARLIESEVRYPVIDKTGLKGTYDITLRWTKATPGKPPAAAPPAPLLTPALKAQLGLTVTLARGPWEFIIIDGMYPTLN